MRPTRAADLDTIVAAATPVSRIALALVRISGAGALPVLRAIAPGISRTPRPRVARLVELRDPLGVPFDRALATYYPSPNSYTGEDVVEITIHGNPILARKLLAAAAAAGAREAEAGEFSRRAFLNGKLGLTEAESVRELIEAKTEAAALGALSRLSGALSSRLARVRESLLLAATLWTAAIDFPEQAGEENPGEIDRHLSDAHRELSDLVRSAAAGARVFSGVRVAIAGPPNAGKSTIFNALLGRDRAIVTPHPGTTRDTLEGEIELEGLSVVLIDTAGLRETAEPIESEGIGRARGEIERADVVVYARVSGESWDEGERAFWAGLEARPRLLVSNKIDLRPPDPAEPGIRVCALSDGAPAVLRDALAKILREDFQAEAATQVVSRRQRDLFERAEREVARARESLARRDPAEISVFHAEEALGILRDLVGETTTEDALDRLFSRFCIGK
jgi:tRNA modification GTPase